MYIILDKSRNSVLFFNNQGKFLSLFHHKDYDLLDLKFASSDNFIFLQTRRSGFAFTDKENFDIIINRPEKFYQVWTCDLNKAQNYKFEIIKNFAYPGFNLFPVSKNEFLASIIFSAKNLPDKDAFELNYIQDNVTVSRFFPYNQRRFSLYADHLDKVSFFNSGNSNPVLFTRPFDYHIYSFNNGQVGSRYEMVFPAAQSLPPDIREMDLPDATSFEILKKKFQGAVQNIYPVLFSDDYMVFWLSTLQPDNMRDFKQYILDLKSHTLINAKLVTPDAVSYNIPVNFTGLLAEHNSSLYGFMFANELKDATSGADNTLPGYLQSFIRQNIPNANPVIVRLIKKQP